MNRNIIIANIVLLIMIVFLGYLVATTRYTPPDSTDFATLQQESQKISETSETTPAIPSGSETEYNGSGSPKPELSPTPAPNPDSKNVTRFDAYPAFGKAPIFNTIIPKPTPRPRPPTPTPAPPDINKLTARWALVSVFGDTAYFMDNGNKQEWQMKVGETRKVDYRRKDYYIELKNVDQSNFKATLYMEEGSQSRTMSLF